MDTANEAMPDRSKDLEFARVAVRWKHVDGERASECLRQQVEEDSSRPVSEIMIEKGYITPEQAKVIADLAEQPSQTGNLGAFKLISKIAQGAVGAVYKARQLSLDRIVAVKVLPRSLARDEQYVARFLREAKAAASLSHPNIVGAVDAGEAGGFHYFAMEYVEGESLGVLLRREKTLPENRALEIAIQMAYALECAHKHGMVHRDVKPDNILIDAEGTAKLADLGLAKHVSDEANRLTQAGTVMGTPHYIAPEQARGDAEVDIRADIYSLGATLYHMVTGETPFSGSTPTVVSTKHLLEEAQPAHERNPEVSERTSRVIQKMMAKDPEARYATPTELVWDLDLVYEGDEPELAGAGSLQERGPADQPREMDTVPLAPVRPGTLRPVVPTLIAGGTALLLAGVLAAILLMRGGGAEKEALMEYEAVEAMVRSGEPETALARARRAAASYAETEYGPRLDAQAERIAAEIEKAERLAARKRQEEEEAGRREEERTRRDAAERGHDQHHALAMRALKVGDLDVAEAQAKKALSFEPDGDARKVLDAVGTERERIAAEARARERCLAAVAEAKALHARGELDEAIVTYGDARELAARARMKTAEIDSGVELIKDEKRRTALLARAKELAEQGKLRGAQKAAEAAAGNDEIGRQADALKADAATRLQVTNSIGMRLLWVDSGEFEMGSEESDPDERPVHGVRLDACYVSVFPVTNAQYERFRPDRPASARKYSPDDDCPAVRLTWDESVAFCEWLSAKEGATYRLPTEAEWEYAARGPTGRIYPWGASPPGIDRCNLGWGTRDKWASDGHEFASPVPAFRECASPWGMCDMAGNVWEWCADFYDEKWYAHKEASRLNPGGPRQGGTRVVRGGSFIDDVEQARSSYRGSKEPDVRASNIGFRVVREVSR